MSRAGRRPNFQKDEMEALVRAIESRRDVMYGEFVRINANGWDRIAEEVNALNDGSVVRTGKEVMTKWKYFKLDMKKTILMKRGVLEECKRKKRPQSPLSPFELRIEALIGEESLQRGLMVPKEQASDIPQQQAMKNEPDESYSEGSLCSLNNYQEITTPTVEMLPNETPYTDQGNNDQDVKAQRHDELMEVLRELSHHVERLADAQEARLKWEVQRIPS